FGPGRAGPPSLGSAQSSIFSGGKVPGGASAAEPSGAVPVGKDEGDQVDFSARPLDAAGASILQDHPPQGGGEGGNIDWAAPPPEDDSATGLAPPGPLPGAGRGPRPGEKTPAGGSTDDLGFPMPPAAKGKSDPAAKGKAKLAAKPLEDENLDDPSVVL